MSCAGNALLQDNVLTQDNVAMATPIAQQENGRTLMTTVEQSRRQHEVSDAGAAQSGSNELVKLIRKLRWIGMDDEAERLQVELTRRHAAADSVVAMSRETD
jgi:hypothetical protein